jgi:hypothetical protein
MNDQYGQKSASRLWLAGIAALSVFLPGCITSTANLNLSDSNSAQYEARVKKTFEGRQMIELDYSRSKGDSREYYPAGTRINLDKREFIINSPTYMDVDFALSTASIKWGMRTLRQRWINLNVYAGLRGTLLEMDYMENSLPRHLNNYSYGPTVSFEAIIPFLDSLSAQYRLTGSYMWMDNRALSYRSLVTLNFHPVPALDFYGGWYSWDYQNSEHASDINAELQGPLVGVNLSF